MVARMLGPPLGTARWQPKSSHLVRMSLTLETWVKAYAPAGMGHRLVLAGWVSAWSQAFPCPRAAYSWLDRCTQMLWAGFVEKELAGCLKTSTGSARPALREALGRSSCLPHNADMAETLSRARSRLRSLGRSLRNLKEKEGEKGERCREERWASPEHPDAGENNGSSSEDDQDDIAGFYIESVDC